MDISKITKPEHLNKLDKDGLIAFLRSVREDKVEVWNNWRIAHDWKPIDLTGGDLSGLHLPEVDLWITDLEKANLSNTCLWQAILNEADLSDARLTGADLRRAQLKDAALSNIAPTGLQGVRLHQTYFWGVLSLRYDQFLDEHGHSTIWEDTEGRFSEAKDVYKSLKGYFEDAGDYEGANWAFGREQVMEKWMVAPRPLRWLYPRWRGKWQGGFCAPNLARWLGLELSDKLAGYGLSLWRPFFALAAVVLLFALIYWLGGTITSTPGCSYAELAQQWRAGCAPTSNPLDALLFSLGALTSTEIGAVRPYLSHVGLLMTLEVLLGIALTGLFGFVLGNKLRYS